ncbi:MAG: 5-formyltetrahydrofolate cyclo-ligase [Actinomycetes bacterium]|jgi:5-formyltetrahydrofolate cyclo-ligase|nr:5-formyltetrahydrofolate cyclo-ligase [Actinomycetes bacterium]
MPERDRETHDPPASQPGSGAGASRPDVSADAKVGVRAAARAARAALSPAARLDADRRVAERLAALPVIQAAAVIAGYAPTRGELDPNGFVELLGAALVPTQATAVVTTSAAAPARPVLVFPRVTGPGQMALHACAFDDLRAGAYGIAEPAHTDPVYHPDRLDVILVPGLAFDRAGHRLGYGKGYYDRLLAMRPPGQTRPVTIGISYDETLFQALPTDPHDIAVDLVVTPTETIPAF